MNKNEIGLTVDSGHTALHRLLARRAATDTADCYPPFLAFEEFFSGRYVFDRKCNHYLPHVGQRQNSFQCMKEDWLSSQFQELLGYIFPEASARSAGGNDGSNLHRE